jgi:hypothetical protein
MDDKNGSMSPIVALITTFVLTVFFALGSFFLMQKVLKVDTTTNWVGLLFFLTCVAFAGSILRLFGKYCLYPKEAAKLEMVGGVKYGTQLEAVFSGKSATWPFAKLLVDGDKLWLRTPWGMVTYYRLQLPTITVNASPLFPSLSIDDKMRSTAIKFSFFPWYCKKLVKKLKVLGYRFSQE